MKDLQVEIVIFIVRIEPQNARIFIAKYIFCVRFVRRQFRDLKLDFMSLLVSSFCPSLITADAKDVRLHSVSNTHTNYNNMSRVYFYDFTFLWKWYSFANRRAAFLSIICFIYVWCRCGIYIRCRYE